MSVLSWYLAKDFLRYLVLCVAAMVLLLVVANLFGEIESAFSSWSAFLDFLDRTTRSLPTFLEIIFPMSILLATVLTFSSLSHTSELLAMKAAGLGMTGMIWPILVVLVPISMLAYVNQNYVYNWLHDGAGRPGSPLEHDVWRNEGDQIYYFQSVHSRHKRLSAGTIFHWLEQPFRLTEMTSFSGAQLADSAWHFQDVVRREKAHGGWRVETAPDRSFETTRFPDVFRPYQVDAHHMPIAELTRELAQLEKRSTRVVVYLLEWYQKIAVFFAPFVLVLVAAPLSQSQGGRARVAGEVVVTIFGGAVYWICNEIFLILGRGGVIPPLLSAWGVNGVFLLLGLLLLARAR